MATVNEEREALQTRLHELAAVRAEVDAEVGRVQYALEVLARVEVPPARAKLRRMNAGGSPRTVDLAVEIINETGRRTWRVDDVIEALEARDWGSHIANKTNAVRTSLGRAVERGLIARHGQGEYVSLAFQDEPTVEPPDMSDDPWRTTPVGASVGWSDEPPF